MPAPKKTPDGLAKVLFLRVDAALLDALDVALHNERARAPHATRRSRADLVRELIWEALETRCERGEPRRKLKPTKPAR